MEEDIRSMIDIEDIVQAATKLNVDLTINDINFITRNFNDEAKMDPTATWDLVLENLIYNTQR